MASRIPDDAFRNKTQAIDETVAVAQIVQVAITDDPRDYLLIDLIYPNGGRTKVAVCAMCLRKLSVFIDQIKETRPHIFRE